MFLLCSVISAFPSLSKNCLQMLDTFRYSYVVCGDCITDHKQAVPHSVCVEWSFRTTSNGQDIHHFMSNIVVDNCELKIMY